MRFWNEKRDRCAGVPAQNAQPAQVRAAVGQLCVFVVSVLGRAFFGMRRETDVPVCLLKMRSLPR